MQHTPQKEYRLVSIADAARILGVSRDTIRRYIKRQILPARKLETIWRIPEEDVMRIAKEGLRIAATHTPDPSDPLIQEAG